MTSVGERLRWERVSRDMTLQEIAAATRIQISYLEALERNEFATLPGRAYGKFYIRAYADLLGFDPASLIAEYDSESSGSTPGEVILTKSDPRRSAWQEAIQKAEETDPGPSTSSAGATVDAAGGHTGPASEATAIADAPATPAAPAPTAAPAPGEAVKPPAHVRHGEQADSSMTRRTTIVATGLAVVIVAVATWAVLRFIGPSADTTGTTAARIEPAAQDTMTEPGEPAAQGVRSGPSEPAGRTQPPAQTAQEPSTPAAPEEPAAEATLQPAQEPSTPTAPPEPATQAAPQSAPEQREPSSRAEVALPPTPAGAGTLRVEESGVGDRIENLKLSGQAGRFVEGSVVYFQTRVVGGATGMTVRHVWLREGSQVQAIDLDLGSSSWRTHSRKTLWGTGKWAVEARDAEGRVLARSTFTVDPQGG